MQQVSVVGGGLAGSEAAWQLARRGLNVRLFEMRPGTPTGAHLSGDLAELVCSNSLGSSQPDRAAGVLNAELRQMGSLLLECAEETALPAGRALAVDRAAFARRVTERICAEPLITVVREEVTAIPDGLAVICSGPLTSPALSAAIQDLTGEEHLFFFDAVAPIVLAETVNMQAAYRGSRYSCDEEEGDYLNCPMNREQYDAFLVALLAAERIPLRAFEEILNAPGGVKAGAQHFFEGCLPVEIIAGRDRKALAFGPLRPIGLHNPHHDGKGDYAVLQLRQDNLRGDLYNMVGFQTNLTYPEQERVFRMIPGLEQAEFARYGQMHRNTFIASPRLLAPTLEFRARPGLFFAGQITGVEGYLGNIATGLLAGWNAARRAGGMEPLILPELTMLGALCKYVTEADLQDFQPMKANFGIMPRLEGERIPRPARGGLYAQRARTALAEFFAGLEGEVSA
jgi:methylenetetrahydrofolate--tRNA-(uracil-5-)-methyltransferase